jgi:hypothetical protein
MGYSKRYASPEAIRESLGLLPWDEWERQVLAERGSDRPVLDPKRRTGRTTKMLCEALYTLQFEPILVRGFNKYYTEILNEQLKVMANKLCIYTHNLKDSYAKGFHDHYKG